MGTVPFTHSGEIANADLGDGVEGKVQTEMEKLPKDIFYWLSGKNPTSMVPYAEFREGIIVIDVKDDRCGEVGKPSIGFNPPTGSAILQSNHDFLFLGIKKQSVKLCTKQRHFNFE